MSPMKCHNCPRHSTAKLILTSVTSTLIGIVIGANHFDVTSRAVESSSPIVGGKDSSPSSVDALSSNSLSSQLRFRKDSGAHWSPPPVSTAPVFGTIKLTVVQNTRGHSNKQSQGSRGSADPAADRVLLRAVPEPWFSLQNATNAKRNKRRDKTIQIFSDIKMEFVNSVDFDGERFLIPAGNVDQWTQATVVDTNMWSILQLIIEREPRGIRLLRKQFGVPDGVALQLSPAPSVFESKEADEKGEVEEGENVGGNEENGVHSVSTPTFRQLADAFKDDKGYLHHYDQSYAHYLYAFTPYSEHLSVLEVGLGCDQKMGIGSSVRLWTKYLPKCRLTMLEFDGACAAKWTSDPKNIADAAPAGGLHMYVGDAGSYDTWRSLIKKDGSRTYDFIIDDGGHTMQQQIVTFFSLWPSLKRGGVYVIEDLATSYYERHGGSVFPDARSPTTSNLIGTLMHRLHAVPTNPEGSRVGADAEFTSPFARVDCFHNICFITKR